LRLPRVRFRIRRLMTVVAVAAGLFAWLGVPGAVAFTAAAMLILTPTFLALFAHIVLARPGFRLLVATWVASFWPFLFLWSNLASWLIAFGVLGHRPGPTDNVPVPVVLVFPVVVLMYLSLMSPFICLILALVPAEKPVAVVGHRRSRAVPLVLMPVVYLSVIAVIRWTPLGFIWFIN
jgi:hypothetical protein